MNPALADHLRILGLERAAFPPTPDASAWFQTPTLESALVEAAHCLRTRAGFVLLTGEVGTGKSTFVRRLLQTLEGEGVVTSLVFNTFLQDADLLAAVLRDFGLEAAGTPAADIETLNRFLVQRWQQQMTCVLVIDDAQNLSIESLELLRLLTNLETGQEKLLQIVLAGQPELRDNLDQARIRQLTSRICKHVRLDVMTPQEIRRYVEFRLAAAGNTQPGIALDDAAIAALHRASGGNPRRIHLIMDRCLYGLYGRAPTDRSIGAPLVRIAAAEAGALPARRRPRLPFALAASLAGLLAVSTLALLPRDADSHDDIHSPVVTVVPAAPATDTAPPSPDAGWNACLQRFAGDSMQVQPVTAAWIEHLPTREDLCLRQDGDAWQAAWRVGLRAEDFLSSSGGEHLQSVQALLLGQGLYDGALDGLYGPRMRIALRRFQDRHGLPASGMPDPATLFLFDTLLTRHAPSRPSTPREAHDHGHG